ncbi:hypothetical protein KNJ79_05000 [Sphingopyxis indica]|uniref:hypothetical protein n=1 Tax=Sphingopyxis indica TaxID=436663 RepID=UPI0029393A48|nr:hypothetical protein [Sphingopyxis indica]WOF44289.1 hypothetical protein KNJ79_05000 [Sphingopyxis indica]
MTPEYRHNGPTPTERIADYLDSRADRFAKESSSDARIRANALRVEASNIRAGLIEG